MRRPLALKPFCCKKGCTAAGNSLTLGGFVPAASAASYAHLIASMTIRSGAGFNSTCDRLGWVSPLLAHDHHEGGRSLCRQAKSSTAALDSKMSSPISVVHRSRLSTHMSGV